MTSDKSQMWKSYLQAFQTDEPQNLALSFPGVKKKMETWPNKYTIVIVKRGKKMHILWRMEILSGLSSKTNFSWEDRKHLKIQT